MYAHMRLRVCAHMQRARDDRLRITCGASDRQTPNVKGDVFSIARMGADAAGRVLDSSGVAMSRSHRHHATAAGNAHIYSLRPALQRHRPQTNDVASMRRFYVSVHACCVTTQVA